ncbi:MAG: bifunctional methylenetetrahydrofolate dehydrogenase/methenyltetrahydrofolate cyclohydrolase, partial [Candidatus Neomarinimicrobiota bacterium]
QTEDKNVVIAGRSRLVSAPLAKILSSKSYNANVSIIHSRTTNQKLFTKEADIFISAIGSAKMYDSTYFKNGATIIDIGISSVDGKTYGDIDIDKIGEVISSRAPFPGGVGPITVSALFFNLSRLIKIN